MKTGMSEERLKAAYKEGNTLNRVCRRRKDYTKKCKICSKEFQPWMDKQEACGEYCSKQLSLAKAREKRKHAKKLKPCHDEGKGYWK